LTALTVGPGVRFPPFSKGQFQADGSGGSSDSHLGTEISKMVFFVGYIVG
jgi:hypothetical protein